MAELGETPRGSRVRIAFFGLRNAGKSTLVNALLGQDLSIVSPTPGTTTDPVSKAMEILPLGPCLVTDTAGLDDVGALGEQRVARTLDVLAATDVAVWVEGAEPDADSPWRRRFAETCAARRVPVLVHARNDSVETLKSRLADVKPAEAEVGLLDGVVRAGERIVCVCPIDESAPKGRLILPQQQVLRAALDRHLVSTVCQVAELGDVLRATRAPVLLVTDSQAFASVRATVRESGRADVRLTSFSILFARQKGDLDAFAAGLDALASLKDGDRVLVAEGCTHRRACNDIGTTKIPAALRKITGRDFEFVFASGAPFALDEKTRLVIQCGGCMLTRREVLRRIEICRAARVPIVNYGMLLFRAAAGGVSSQNLFGECIERHVQSATRPRHHRSLTP